jgi:hypothetical protein
MVLFPRTNKGFVNPDSHRRPPRGPRRPGERGSGGLPEFMHRLDLLCRQTVAHQLPVRMQFISEALSDRGRPTAVYACPFTGCTWREGWVLDKHSPGRKPFQLWAGFHRR